MRNALFLAVASCAGLVSLGPSTLMAKRPPALAALARQAKQRFQPVIGRDAEQARTDLRRALQRLDDYLSRQATDRQADWRAYLQWGVLQEQLETPQPNRKICQSILERYRGRGELSPLLRVRGLELPPFAAAREALDWYLAASLLAASEQSQASATSRSSM